MDYPTGISEQRGWTGEILRSEAGDKESEVEEWLSRSAIGKLKEFASVDQVNRNLEDKGIEFSSSYMGVSVEELPMPVSSEWLTLTLGLNPGLMNKANQEFEFGKFHRASGEEEWGLVERS
ncbi:hypothetical protein QYF36_014648 [Acer negundo]|nr:hypothetical protein QYF36_014648 [Acer negundo]